MRRPDSVAEPAGRPMTADRDKRLALSSKPNCTESEQSVRPLPHADKSQKPLSWFERDGAWFASPYRLYRTVQGWDAWIYGKHGPKIVARAFPNANKAKTYCDAHHKRNTGVRNGSFW